MSKIYILLFHLIHIVYSTGEWATCTSDNLALAQQDVINMDTEIRQLLVDNSVTITDTDVITIESCQSQVVAGTNFRLTTHFGIIQYYVGLPTDPNRVNRVPTNFQYLGANTDTNTLCMCTMQWDPVCYQGTTYGNECGAKCAGATEGTFTMGECATIGTGTITGGYNDYTDLITIQIQINEIENDIKILLKDSGIDISDNALISITSAQTQVVAGVNYQVTMDIGSYTNIIIQYFIGLDENNQIPQDLQLIDAGENRVDINMVGAYNDVSDLTYVTNTVSDIDSVIRELLISQGMSITDNDMISIVSATQQVVAGMNYMITLNIGTYTNVIIKYFIGLDENNQNPQNLEIIDLGSTIGSGGVIIGGWSDVNDLEYTKGIVDSIHDGIILLLQNNNLNINNNAEIVVIAAQSQVVAGTNYRVSMNIGIYINVIIEYYIGIPILIEGEPVIVASNLQLIDAGESRIVVGGYSVVTNDVLNDIKITIVNIENNIRDLLINEGLGIDDSDSVTVISAQSQVVAGMNYRVTINVGLHENIIIQYCIKPGSDIPIDLQVIDLGIGGVYNYGNYKDIDSNNLQQVREDINKIEGDLRILFVNNNILQPGENAAIIVVSAQKQIVAGTNYKVTLIVGMYKVTPVIISYFVPLLSDDTQQQMPIDLKLINSGSMTTGSFMDISSDNNQMELVKQDIISVKNEIILALNGENIHVSNDANIQVISAQSQVVSGTNYKAIINIGNRQNVVVEYYIPLPIDGQRQSVQNMQVIDVGDVETETEMSDNDGDVNTKVQRVWIIAAVVFILVIIGCIVSMSLWNKKRKLQKMEEKYAKLKEQEMSTTDAIAE